MPPKGEPLHVYGDAAKFRVALRRKVDRGRDLLAELDAAESRVQPPPPGLTGLAYSFHDLQHRGVAEALPTWDQGIHQILKRYLGSYPENLLPDRRLGSQRGLPALARLAEQRAIVEGRLSDLGEVLRCTPGRRVDTAPRAAPLFAELRAAQLLSDDALDGYVRRMTKTGKPAERSDAIGAVKELLEAVFKATIDLTGGTYKKDDQMPGLSKEVRRGLKAQDAAPTPEGVHMLDRMFSGLTSVEQALTELRNAYGSGHGRTAHPEGLAQRHALLAVDAATAHVRYLVLTLQDLGLLTGPPDS